MRRSTDRILTTHTGSLARPDDLLAMMRDKENKQPYDVGALAIRTRNAVIAAVQNEIECGIDIPSDGEQSKSGFGSYQAERLSGFEPDPKPPARNRNFQQERDAFPEYYENYYKHTMRGAMLAPNVPMVCTGPVRYIGQAELQADIRNFKAGLEGQPFVEAFMPSANALFGLGKCRNEYYQTQRDYIEACFDAMRQEYQAIIDAGFVLQIDDPHVATLWGGARLNPTAQRKHIDERVELINHMLRSLPRDRIRYHTCYSINQGPHIFDLHLKDFIASMLRINAEAVSFEQMNSRHMHGKRFMNTV